MQEHVQLTQREINRDLLGGVLSMPKWWLGAVAVLSVIFLAGAVSFGYMVNQGVGVTGLNRPVFWGVFMVNFVFWIGISHAGIMISAILRLTRRSGAGRLPGPRKCSPFSPSWERTWRRPWCIRDGRGGSTGSSPTTFHGECG